MFELPKRFAVGGMDGLEESIPEEMSRVDLKHKLSFVPQHFYRKGFVTHDFILYPEDPEQEYRFKLVVSANFDAGAFTILLEGAVGTGPMQAVGRYDVHDNEHTNCPKCCPTPPSIAPGAFHVHRYNVCCLDRGHEWHKCADYLPGFDASKPMSANLGKLIGDFLAATNTRFAGGDSQVRLFRTVQP